MQAYTEFGDAVKHVFHLATRIAASKGFPHSVEPMEPDAQANTVLSDAESARARAWEAVLLLGDPATVDAARAWWHEVWRFVWFARGLCQRPLRNPCGWSGDLLAGGHQKSRLVAC
jgi:hypothetical protein